MEKARKHSRRWLLLGSLLLSGCGGLLDNVITVVPPPAADRPLHDVRQARTELVGQPAETVVARVGPPDRTSTTGAREWWTYYDHFRDPVTGLELPTVTLRFRTNHLEAISY